MRDTNLISKKSWEEFRSTGLLLFVNHFLHIFGWAIVFEFSENKVITVYPARVKFRGFPESTTDDAFKNITTHIRDSIEKLVKEVE
ncbi:hypothetical protein FH581_017240 (plasmid) [Leptospira weilii]|uniref:hypothetical protein n=1 Tax=Leptospira weilii TaxID=28184 RepID=UPI001EF32C55|nr:hypothetical protein [Leptospira weilii]ULH29024.1 hypothetical protein FH586_03530 [Leptospira weilii]UPY79925.1 hypothetical protein FH581_018045 [Leptospira weilii]UPY80845.1 hypothetical protein FH581_022495 [Leptospira weilii]UPY80897.1 hypothetical protein FH581_017240 [Leptospira weilii]